MKHNIVYFLVLCGLFLTACQYEPELDNEMNPGDASEDEPQEVTFSFSFDFDANSGIEYEPITRGETGENNVRISNEFFYIVEVPITNGTGNITDCIIVQLGTAKFNSEKDKDSYVYLPDELDSDFFVSFVPLKGASDYVLSVFTGANAVDFNTELKPGTKYSDYGAYPLFAVRYKEKQAHIINHGGEIERKDYFLDEVIYFAKQDLTIKKNDYLVTGESTEPKVKIDLCPVVNTIRPLITLPGPEVPEEWGLNGKPMVAALKVSTGAFDAVGFCEGIELWGGSWFNRESKNESYLYYYIDPDPQQGSDDNWYLTGTPAQKKYYLFSWNVGGVLRDFIDNYVQYEFESISLYPAGMMSLYDSGYANYETGFNPIIDSPLPKLSLNMEYAQCVNEMLFRIEDDGGSFKLEFEAHGPQDGGWYQGLFPYNHDSYKPENE